MIGRIVTAIRLGLYHRKQLTESVRSGLILNSVLDLDPKHLPALNIKALALDFDGVLATHGQDRPASHLESWIDACVTTLGTGRVFLLSNRRCDLRDSYMRQRFADVAIICPESKKPDPEGLNEIARHTGLEPGSIALVDDRLLTGGLAANAAGCRFIYVRTALSNFRGSPVKESWFSLLRAGERRLLGLVGAVGSSDQSRT